MLFYGIWVNSQFPCSSSQLIATPLPRGLVPSSDLWRHQAHTHTVHRNTINTCRQNTHIIFRKKKKNSTLADFLLINKQESLRKMRLCEATLNIGRLIVPENINTGKKSVGPKTRAVYTLKRSCNWSNIPSVYVYDKRGGHDLYQYTKQKSDGTHQ